MQLAPVQSHPASNHPSHMPCPEHFCAAHDAAATLGSGPAVAFGGALVVAVLEGTTVVLGGGAGRALATEAVGVGAVGGDGAPASRQLETPSKPRRNQRIIRWIVPAPAQGMMEPLG
jgi:hypothetical protein